MRPLTRILATSVAAFVAMALAVVGCSKSDESSAPSGSSGTTTPGFRDCTKPTSAKCSDAEYKPYSDCVSSHCDSAYKECYGPDYRAGTFSGPCAAFISCTQKCDCSDTSCLLACTAEGDCSRCLDNSTSCAKACTLPACATSSSSGGVVTNATCATLDACCSHMIGADRIDCDNARHAANGNDSSCAGYYNALKLAGRCP